MSVSLFPANDCLFCSTSLSILDLADFGKFEKDSRLHVRWKHPQPTDEVPWHCHISSQIWNPLLSAVSCSTIEGLEDKVKKTHECWGGNDVIRLCAFREEISKRTSLHAKTVQVSTMMM